MKIILTLFLLMPFPALSQEIPIRWTGEMRFRTEADGRDFNLQPAPNLYTLSRIRLGMDIQPIRTVSLTIKIQDSRHFGE